MAKEIERRWLLDKTYHVLLVQKSPLTLIKQGYIFVSLDKQLRVRLIDGKTFLCLKYTEDLVRDEYEYEIPLIDGLEILKKCEWKLEKIRKELKSSDGFTHYIDLYPNGLLVVEVEFKDKEEAESFNPPVYFGLEITGNRIYSNITLAKLNLHF